MRRTQTYKQVDVEIEIEDVLEFIEQCNQDEKRKIIKGLNIMYKPMLSNNLQDDIKLSYMKDIFEKYDIDELRQLVARKIKFS